METKMMHGQSMITTRLCELGAAHRVEQGVHAAITIAGAAIRADLAVPRSLLTTANMPALIARRFDPSIPRPVASIIGAASPSTEWISRGTTMRPLAIRAAITASCKGEVRT